MPTFLAVDDHRARTPALTTCQARWMSYSSRRPAATTTRRVGLSAVSLAEVRRGCEDLGRALLASDPFGGLAIRRRSCARRVAFLEDWHDQGVELRAVGRDNSPELQAE